MALTIGIGPEAPVTIGSDTFTVLTVGAVFIKDPDYRDDLGSLDGGKLDEFTLDEQ